MRPSAAGRFSRCPQDLDRAPRPRQSRGRSWCRPRFSPAENDTRSPTSRCGPLRSGRAACGEACRPLPSRNNGFRRRANAGSCVRARQRATFTPARWNSGRRRSMPLVFPCCGPAQYGGWWQNGIRQRLAPRSSGNADSTNSQCLGYSNRRCPRKNPSFEVSRHTNSMVDP